MQYREHSSIVTEKVRASDELCASLENRLSKLEFQDDPKARLITSCFDLVIEHHISIIFLVKSHRFASAFALIRVQYEALIRGIWMKYCAPNFDTENKDAVSKVFAKKLDKMVREIESHIHLCKIFLGQLANFQETVNKRMNDYVHSGYSAISSRSTNDFIEANYVDEEIVEALNLAVFFVIGASISLAELAENDEALRYFQTLSTDGNC